MPTTLVFFERKDRLQQSLKEALTHLGPRPVAVCRELTKIHEEFLLFSLDDTARWPNDLLGEVTVVIGPGTGPQRTDEEDVLRLLAAAAPDKKPREVVRDLLPQVNGWTSKELYALLTRTKNRD